MTHKLLDSSVPKFLMVGVANTLLTMLFMFLLERSGYWVSTAIAYTAGAVLSFFLNRTFTFHSKETPGKAAVKFAVNVVLCYLLAYGIAKPLVTATLQRLVSSPLWRERLAKLGGMGLYTVFNYFGQRFFAFQKTAPEKLHFLGKNC